MLTFYKIEKWKISSISWKMISFSKFICYDISCKFLFQCLIHCCFSSRWVLNRKDLIFILSKYPQDKTKSYCVLCMKVASVAREGKYSLDEHAEGQGHRNIVPREI